MQNYSVSVTSDTPAPFQQIKIPLSDGTILHARLWLPEKPLAEKVPLVLEWIPYRQSDGTALADSMMHGYFAESGIAAARVDIRGSGNSDGLLHDEYLKQEQDDACEVIEWFASQDWCNGSVGLIGISWGGFAGLQIAARRPPALKAIVTACSTDNRYTDDVHYMGGTLLSDGMQWGNGLFAQLGRPADPKHVGDRWKEIWLNRLNGIDEPPLATWMQHTEYDEFWKHGSVCEDYDDITCAVWAVGGWVDGYTDPILRLMENLSAPKKALIGPWTHMYPTWGQPGPKIGFLQECMRWWRHWLMDEDTGIMDEPQLQLWLGKDPEPDTRNPEIGGRWIGLPSWPPTQEDQVFTLDDRRLSLSGGTATEKAIMVDSPLSLGTYGGEWCPLDGGGNGPEFAADARADDGQSVCFETMPLTEPLYLVGYPVLKTRLAFMGPKALVVLRLNEVMPDGTSGRITFALRRLTRPEGVAPGEMFEAEIPLKGVTHEFSPGNRIRLAVSTSYWPMAWPEGKDNAVTFDPASLSFTLPGMPPETDHTQPEYGPPVHACPVPTETVAPGSISRDIVTDLASGQVEVISKNQRATWTIDGLTIGGQGGHSYAILPDDGQSARARFVGEQHFTRDDWTVRMKSSSDVFWEGGKMVLVSKYEAFEGEEQVFERKWRHEVDY
ncbi:CocE/NonD family hydrolase [Pelagovum pacificum]|uniref:CocE/NonD family hydrolase n=1 Tax=Pelagovum pacificum TaxID=2588711 RepID=A0A5C5G8E7_9RHOB|nr:CocE/NonD family hydrolase [Pelagovum pacificum]QQA41729.1 CocE/NonD family hydrolase [Pelagovum pacificum]TNY31004.1 CocE/NonD family hydrolase [Pelagovum pacificum]